MASFSNITKSSAGKITSNFGYRIHPVSKKRKFHYGIDVAHPSGTQILAMSDGVVTDSAINNNACGGTIRINHGKIDGNEIQTRFCHVKQLLKKVGDKVKKGEVIAISGGAKSDVGRGTSTGAHVHFEVKVNGKNVDPTPYYNGTISYQKTDSSSEKTPDDLPTPDEDETPGKEVSPELSKALETLKTDGKSKLDVFGGKLDPIMKGFEKAFSQFGMNPIVKEEVDRIKQLLK